MISMPGYSEGSGAWVEGRQVLKRKGFMHGREAGHEQMLCPGVGIR